MAIIAVLNDLFFAAKIRAAATATGVNLVLVKDRDMLMDEIKKQQPEKIILDLNFNKFSLAGAMAGINTENIYVIGFLSHIQTGLRKEAEKYCDLVLPRSDFSNRLPELLSM